ncbi:MAG TPA: LytR C-terminal domain-containing protein [Candidatus Cloacimonadota bacterium]|nr:LytR C-terminal domain-containing protein [Candidatus Cloacimonadota bacterium]HPT71516.1 LytR C-terminal domain-containing protein [Candidatus Cloacimonadota bacterium]
MNVPENNLTRGNGKKRLLLILVVVLLIALTIGIIVYRHYAMEKKAQVEATLPSIKISLLNGCGFEGAASEMTDFLGKKNIEIVATGNAPKFIYNKTIIVVKKMDQGDLQRLMEMTGIQQWTMAETDYPIAPFVIIIGKDYEQLIADQKNEKE